jgi:hypothetical protein
MSPKCKATVPAETVTMIEELLELAGDGFREEFDHHSDRYIWVCAGENNPCHVQYRPSVDGKRDHAKTCGLHEAILGLRSFCDVERYLHGLDELIPPDPALRLHQEFTDRVWNGAWAVTRTGEDVVVSIGEPRPGRKLSPEEARRLGNALLAAADEGQRERSMGQLEAALGLAEAQEVAPAGGAPGVAPPAEGD